MIVLLYGIVLLGFSVYSYALIDPNLSLMSNKYWVLFRDPMVQLGYYQRPNSWYLYLALIILLYIFYYYFLRQNKKYNPFKISLVIGAIMLFSYPMLSHDFFNYIFDAKILTFYGQNPYLHKALDFPTDDWTRFMHWTHRSYPYGPFFLVLTLIPSYAAMGKFILNYFFFKALFVGFYILGVYYLGKIDKKSALVFATHPLVIIEGLVSTHNDLIAVSLGFMGFFYILQNKQILGRLAMILSAAIKFTTIPLIFVTKNNKKLNLILLIVQIGLLLYLVLFREIQQWYFLTLFAFLPLYKDIIRKVDIFLFGLLISYYPYIFLGGWDTDEKLAWKYWIIGIGFGLNVMLDLFQHLKSSRS